MLGQYLNLPRAVHILCVGTFINRAGSFFVVFLAMYVTGVLGLDERFATRTMGLFGAGSIAAALLGGHLADHIGRRTVMLVGLYGSAATLILFSFVRSPALIMLLAVLAALTADMYRPAASALMADLTAPHERPRAFSLMYVSINLGFAVGASVGGQIAKVSFQWLYWLDAATSALYGLIILMCIREVLPKFTGRAAAIDAASEASGSAGAEASVPLGQAVRRILRDYAFIVFCAATHLNALVFMQGMTTLPLYMKARGFDPADYGAVVAVNGILIVAGQLPLTALLARFDRGGIVACGAVLTSVGFGATLWAATLWHYAVTVVVWTLGEMFMASFMSAIVSDLAPVDLRARYMGVFGMSFSSAMMIGSPLGGEILGHPRLGGQALWILTFVVGMVSAGLFMMVRTRVARPPQPAAAAQLASGDSPAPAAAEASS